MLTPSIREDLQLFEGTPLEDGSPTWLLFDTLTNKYFTIGLNAFRLLNYWNADVDTKTFIKNVEQKGVNLKEEELDRRQRQMCIRDSCLCFRFNWYLFCNSKLGSIYKYFSLLF